MITICPYLDCKNKNMNLVAGNKCSMCNRFVKKCLSCGSYNRFWSAYCFTCGKPLIHPEGWLTANYDYAGKNQNRSLDSYYKSKDLKGLKRKWSEDTDTSTMKTILAYDNNLVLIGKNTIELRDINTGKKITETYTYDIDGTFLESSIDRGILLVPTVNFKGTSSLNAFQLFNDKIEKIWTYPFPGRKAPTSLPVVVKNSIVLRAFDLETRNHFEVCCLPDAFRAKGPDANNAVTYNKSRQHQAVCSPFVTEGKVKFLCHDTIVQLENNEFREPSSLKGYYLPWEYHSKPILGFGKILVAFLSNYRNQIRPCFIEMDTGRVTKTVGDKGISHIAFYRLTGLVLTEGNTLYINNVPAYLSKPASTSPVVIGTKFVVIGTDDGKVSVFSIQNPSQYVTTGHRLEVQITKIIAHKNNIIVFSQGGGLGCYQLL